MKTYFALSVGLFVAGAPAAEVRHDAYQTINFITVGETNLRIQTPAGFTSISRNDTRFEMGWKTRDPSSRRLLFLYDTHEKRKIDAGNDAKEHYLNVDVFVKGERKFATRRDFAQFKEMFGASLTKAHQQGIDSVKEFAEALRDKKLAKSVVMFPVHHESDRVISFAAAGVVEDVANPDGSFRFASVSSLIILRGKLIQATAVGAPEMAEQLQKENHDWVERMLLDNPSSLGEIIHEIMPFESYTSAIDWWEVILAGFRGAIIAVVISLGLIFWRRRKPAEPATTGAPSK